MYKLIFAPDKRGFGALTLYDNMHTIISVKSRSGSIGTDGKLKNCIPGGYYTMKAAPEAPAASEVDKMYIDSLPGFGWKWRIQGSLLVHPDGGLPGTRGCIGTQGTNAMEIYFFAKWYYSRNVKPIPFEVHK